MSLARSVFCSWAARPNPCSALGSARPVASAGVVPRAAGSSPSVRSCVGWRFVVSLAGSERMRIRSLSGGARSREAAPSVFSGCMRSHVWRS